MVKKSWVVSYILADIFCIGLGMGVPFFNIILGFPVGWFLSHRLSDKRKIFKYLLLASFFTFIALASIWFPTMLAFYYDPTKNISDFGEPLFLFDPVASFWGWLVLMVVVSPFLQFLFVIFAAYLTLIFNKKSYKS